MNSFKMVEMALTASELGWVALVLYIVMWAFAIAWLVWPGPRMKRAWVISGIVFFIWTVGSVPKMKQEWFETWAVVTGERVPVYSSFVGGQELFVVSPGQALRILSQQSFTTSAEKRSDRWYYIETEDHQKGWALNPELRLLNDRSYSLTGPSD